MPIQLDRRTVLAALGGSSGLAALGLDSNALGSTTATGSSLDSAIPGNVWVGDAANRSDVNPNHGHVYVATDQDVLYLGTGDSWEALGVGSSEQPVSNVHADAIQAADLHTDGRAPDVVVIKRDSETVAMGPSGRIVAEDENPTPVDTLNAGIDAAPDGGLVAVKGTFVLDQGTGHIRLGGGKTLYGPEATIDIQEATVGTQDTGPDFHAGIYCQGSQESNVSLTQDTSYGDTEVFVGAGNADGIEPGDVVVVRSDDAIRDEGGSDERTWGESHYVRDVEAATDNDDTEDDKVVLEDMLQHAYAGSSAELYHIAPDEAHVEGVSIEGKGSESEVRGITYHRTLHSTVEQVNISECGDFGVRIADSYGTTVEDSTIQDCNIAGQGYGVGVIFASSRTTIRDCDIENCRHAVSGATAPNAIGCPRDTRVVDNYASSGKSSTFDMHGDAISWVVEGNTIHSRDEVGVMCGAVHNKVVNNEIHSSSHRITWNRGSVEEPTTHIIRGNDVFGEQIPYGFTLSRHPTVERAIIEDNTIHGSARRPVSLSSDIINDLSISRNRLPSYDSGDSNNVIKVAAEVSGVAEIADNFCSGCNRTGIYLSDSANYCTVTDNIVRNVNQAGNGAHACIRVDAIGVGGDVKRNVLIEDNGNNPNMVIARESSKRVEIAHNRGRSDDGLDSSTAVDLDGDGSCWRHHNVGHDDDYGTPPSNPDNGTLYLDDGSNHSSGSPGYRKYLDGTWHDL